jgi:hypothetical protein
VREWVAVAPKYEGVGIAVGGFGGILDGVDDEPQAVTMKQRNKPEKKESVDGRICPPIKVAYISPIVRLALPTGDPAVLRGFCNGKVPIPGALRSIYQ